MCHVSQTYYFSVGLRSMIEEVKKTSNETMFRADSLTSVTSGMGIALLVIGILLAAVLFVIVTTSVVGVVALIRSHCNANSRRLQLNLCIFGDKKYDFIRHYFVYHKLYY
jgi:tetrahydromethanopterin S-methyltransferase subunit F